MNNHNQTGKAMAHAIYRDAVFNQRFVTDADNLERREHAVAEDGYTARELRFAYECVRDPNSFRGPFTTTIAPAFLPIVQRAVHYFTNEQIRVLGTDHANGRLVIHSPGQP